MHIHEAIANTNSKTPFITRTAWLLVDENIPAVRLLPTNTPHCCLIVSDYSSNSPTRGWQPRAEDLVADDWFVCGGGFLSSPKRNKWQHRF